MQELVDKLSITQPVVHVVASSDQSCETLELHEGESALVGQAVGCQLRLEDADVAPHQCMLQLRDGILILDDWCGGGATKVNGEFVEEQVTLDLGDIVSFGGYRVQFRLDGDATELPIRPEEVESVESSTLAVLYSEISFLQRELEQRDAALAQAAAKSDLADRGGGESSNSRLNELLTELQVADSRQLCLTDELRLLEELRAAEQEEHRQIAIWVNDVESLVAKREAEQLAQMERLRAQLEQEKEDRLFHQQRADAVIADKGKDESQVALNELRMEYESLREKHKEVSNRADQLHAECETLRAANVDAEVERRVRDAVRVEQLELAQERARLSRREHELSTKLRQPEGPMEIEMPAGDDGAQLLAEEPNDSQVEDADSSPVSTGQRLVKLWQTLDGRSNE